MIGNYWKPAVGRRLSTLSLGIQSENPRINQYLGMGSDRHMTRSRLDAVEVELQNPASVQDCNLLKGALWNHRKWKVGAPAGAERAFALVGGERDTIGPKLFDDVGELFEEVGLLSGE